MNSVGRCLLIFVVLDLSLGGNGYLIHIGGFRIRELLFVLCMAWTAAWLLRGGRFDPIVWLMLGLFLAITALGAAVGFAHGYSTAQILAELKPLAYFPMLLFFAAAIRDSADVRITASVLAWGGAAVALAYLTLLAVIWSGLVSFSSAFSLLRQSDEFIFRYREYGAGFLYKGMFYACIAAIFLLLDARRLYQIIGALALVGVALTVTRSLAYALAATLLISVPLGAAWFRLGASAIAIAVITMAAMHFETKGAVERGLVKAWGSSTLMRETDNLRSEDIRFVVNNLTLKTAFVGNGLGSPIRHRQRTELTYLEILHKQGLIGLSFWSLLFGWLVTLYWRARSEPLALPFFLSGLFVYISTAGLTLLPGSIGMGILFISLAGLLVHNRHARAGIRGIRRGTRDDVVGISSDGGLRSAVNLLP